MTANGKPRSYAGWVTGVCLVAGLVGFVLLGRSKQPSAAPPSLLESVPANAFAVVTVELDGLRATEAGRRLLGEGRRAAGATKVETVCGFDPLDGVRRLAVVLPGQQTEAGFGLFAEGKRDSGVLLDCAERFMRARGGQPRRERVGVFTLLRDEHAAVSTVQMAVGPRGRFIVAEGPYLQASLQTASGKQESLAKQLGPHELTRSVMPASIVVSAALQPAQRTKLESYISKDHPYAALIGRLQAAAFGLRVSDEFTFRLALSCVSSSACEQLVGVLDAARRQARQSLEVKALGLDAWLDRVTVRRSDKSVGLQLILSADDVDAVVTRSKLVESLLESDRPSSAPAAASVAPSAGPPSPSSVKPSPP